MPTESIMLSVAGIESTDTDFENLEYGVKFPYAVDDSMSKEICEEIASTDISYYGSMYGFDSSTATVGDVSVGMIENTAGGEDIETCMYMINFPSNAESMVMYVNVNRIKASTEMKRVAAIYPVYSANAGILQRAVKAYKPLAVLEN